MPDRFQNLAPVRFASALERPTALSAKEQEWAAVADASLARLDQLLASGRQPGLRDISWLWRLQRTLGAGPVTASTPEAPWQKVQLDGRLTLRKLQANPKHLADLRDALLAMRAATNYRPIQKAMPGYALTVHNAQVADMLAPSYSSSQFKRLFERCLREGTFDLQVDEQTGLVKTTDIDPSEDNIMSQIWITDTFRNGDRQRDSHPQAWKQAINKVAAFYMKQQIAFDRVIDNPALYRSDRRYGGVPHIFTDDLEVFDWLNWKRNESHGLALKGFCDSIVAGAEDASEPNGRLTTTHDDAQAANRKPHQAGQLWGYAKSTEVPDAMIEAIGHLVRYFDRIDYPKAPTIGAWEELIFDGLASDVETVRDGLASFRRLMFDPQLDHSAEIRDIRKRVRESKYGAVISDLAHLDDLIARGERKVRERVAEGPHPMQHPDRPEDPDLAFVTHTATLSDDPVEDVRRNLRVLDYLKETVLRPHGVIKYPSFPITLSNGERVMTRDGYLATNWGLEAATVDGQLSLYREAYRNYFQQGLNDVEPSTPDRFHARAADARYDGRESEWFMVADMARGACVQWAKLLQLAERRPLTSEETGLMREAAGQATEAINRGYARITGIADLKANGKPCPDWAVPEAYHAVSTLRALNSDDPEDTRKDYAMMPGINTPLAWAASSLYVASKLYLNNVQRMEHLGLPVG